MALISYLISIAGFVSGLRMLRVFRDRALISRSTVTKTGTIFCASTIVALIFLSEHPIVLLFALTSGLFVIFFALKLLERREIDALTQELPSFLDRWILRIRLGNSLSSARQTALLAASENLRTLLQPIFVLKQDSQTNHLILDRTMLTAFANLEQQPHNALNRLEGLRQSVRQANAFRRKSGQARRQTVVQSVVLLCLQFALAIIMASRYGIFKIFDLLIWSFLLSTLGLILMQYLSRKTKWTI